MFWGRQFCVIFWVLLSIILFSCNTAYCTEVYGVTDDILNQVFDEYGEDVSIRTDNGVTVYTNPYSNESYYEIPVYQNQLYLGSFSVTQQGVLKNIKQSIHGIDFRKLNKIDEVLEIIGFRENSEVKTWRYVFMRDLYTSAIKYQLLNGNQGYYILTSRVLKQDKCLSAADWKYQIEYADTITWESEDLVFINNEIDTIQVVFFLLTVSLVLIIISIVINYLARKNTEN